MASITKRGDSYRVLIRKVGYPPVSETFKRKIDAERWARETETKMDRRVYVVDTGVTVRETFERYRDEVSPLKPGGKWECNRINQFLRSAAWARMTMAQVCYKDLQAWRDERLKAVSAPSVLRELNLVSSVFTHARNEWHAPMAENPCERVKRPPKGKARCRRVADWELKSLQSLSTGEYTVKSYAIVMFEFGIETGLRMGEMVRLRWDHVHSHERWIYVEPSKNGDDRTVPLSDRAIELLAPLRFNEDARVFPVETASVGELFRRMLKKLGIVDLHFHDSRHEACSRLSKIYTVMEMAKIIGHRDLKSLLIYYNPTAQELAQKLVGAALSKPAHPQPTTPACDTASEAVEEVDQENAMHTA